MTSVWVKEGLKLVRREECRVERGTEAHVQPIEGTSNQMPHVGYGFQVTAGYAYSSGFEDWQIPVMATMASEVRT